MWYVSTFFLPLATAFLWYFLCYSPCCLFLARYVQEYELLCKRSTFLVKKIACTTGMVHREEFLKSAFNNYPWVTVQVQSKLLASCVKALSAQCALSCFVEKDSSFTPKGIPYRIVWRTVRLRGSFKSVLCFFHAIESLKMGISYSISSLKKENGALWCSYMFRWVEKI